MANGPNASSVVGQPNFTTSISPFNGTTPSLLWSPTAAHFDSGGNLWVADRYDNRIVEFPSSSLGVNSPRASFAIGERGLYERVITLPNNLYGPSDMALDSSGNLWVSDIGAGRILEFAPPFVNDENASLAIGQPDLYNATGCGTIISASSLCAPTSIAFDSHENLWVGDTGNNRVLEFKAPFSFGEAASVVLGQPNFRSNSCGDNETTICGAISISIAFDPKGNLWVADQNNNRVLEFSNASLSTNGAAASIVLGQKNFTSGVPEQTVQDFTFRGALPSTPRETSGLLTLKMLESSNSQHRS